MPAGSSAQGVLVSRFGHAPKTAFLRSSCVMLVLVLVLVLLLLLLMELVVVLLVVVVLEWLIGVLRYLSFQLSR